MLSSFCVLIAVAVLGLAVNQRSFHKADPNVGAPIADVYPPPTPANRDSLAFPNEAEVGFAGPTPTGAEPFLVSTATSLPVLNNVYPLVSEKTADASDFDLSKSWGYLSPMFSLPKGTFGVDSGAELPPGCALDQVHLVHRHGARYPTSDGGPIDFAQRLHHAAKRGNLSFSGCLSFLHSWRYRLGSETLSPFGRLQLFQLGVSFRQKYGHLLNKFTKANKLPVFRTTSEDRMYKSAINFAAGFFGIPYENQYKQSIIIEELGYNNSLAPYMVCENSNNDIGYASDPVVAKFKNIFLAGTVKRLQPFIKGYHLKISDVYAMMQLCSYETVNLGSSKFCHLFTDEEFKDYAYSIDLEFWYSDSFGNPTSAAQGIGYVTELLAILTKEHTKVYSTSVNSTLANSDVTNPLDQSIYVSATHDTVISAIIVALNFTHFTRDGPLPTKRRPPKTQSFQTVQISPFAATLTGQVLSCPSGQQFRWILNDAVVPLDGLRGCPKDQKYGMCPIKTYIKGLEKRISEVDFDFTCNGNYSYVIPEEGGGVTNGLPPLRH